jgi:transcriptional regulator with GAF, ATPase, and Fis domain
MVSTLENRRLFRQIQRRSTQLETSAEVSRIASTILDPSELLPEVVELIKKGFDLNYAGIFLIDVTGEITGEPNKWAVLQAGSGLPGQQMIDSGHKLEIGGDSMIGTSISKAETNFVRNPYLPETRSEMAFPLISRGQVLGALSIQSDKEGSFTQEDITSLQTMADQLANAIENANLFEQTEARAEELTILNEMARAFTQTLDVDALIKHTFDFTRRLMNAENFYAALFHQETNIIEFKLFVEDGEPIPPPEPKISLGEGLTDWIIKNQLPVLMQTDVTEQMTSMGIPVRGKPAESWLGVPMLIGNTTRVHSSTNAETILKTAVREVSSALGRQAFIELKPDQNGKKLSPDSLPKPENSDQDPMDELPKPSVDSNQQES